MEPIFSFTRGQPSSSTLTKSIKSGELAVQWHQLAQLTVLPSTYVEVYKQTIVQRISPEFQIHRNISLKKKQP